MRQDLVLAGGGLQSALIALASLHAHPARRIAIIEQDEKLGGQHHWSFHAADLPDEARAWAEPLIAHRWDDYEVCFPTYTRRLDAPYATITSERLDQVVRAAFARASNASLIRGRVMSVEADHVILESGERIDGELVVDARGPRTASTESLAYQKFAGLTLRVGGTIPARPVIMDTRVPQERGLRFVYVLPLSADRVLVEDTYYDTSPALDRAALRANILDYTSACGMNVLEVLGEEHGVLPLPLEPTVTPRFSRPLVAGYAGGWLQPTTGYSFPIAVRLAQALASSDAEAAVAALAAQHADQAPFLRRLNRWLFRGIEPEHRWGLFAKFYRLPTDFIARFYAMQMGSLERWRIIAGTPPKGMRMREIIRAVGEA